MALVCERCGIGRRESHGACDWCGAPHRPRLPAWIMGRRWIVRTRLARKARRGSAVATGMMVGVGLHLMVTVFAVAFHLPTVWQSGFLWSQQWWWALVPEAWQPWLFSAVVGIAYGALAGLVAGTGGRDERGTGREGDGGTGRRGRADNRAATDREQTPDEQEHEQRHEAGSVGSPPRPVALSPRRPVSPSPRPPFAPSPATITALVAFIVSGWDPDARTQDRLIAALLAAAIGRLTTLVWRGAEKQSG